MKNLFLSLIFLLAFTVCNAQIVNIPDANFKNALVNSNCVDTNGDGIGDSDADLNNDGEIQVSEAEAVLNLHVDFQNINSLEGIQSFTNLELLDCKFNQLTSLDVSQNTNLELLFCYSNQLTSIDVSQNPNLELLFCYHNQLTSIDVSQNPNLKWLYCYNNMLTSLDVTQNPNLLDLYCERNLLTSLDVTQNTILLELYCRDNILTSLDVTQNPNLLDLSFYENLLTSLDVTQNPNLVYLACSSNPLTSLDVTQNPNLERLYCINTGITSIDLSLNPNFYWLSCYLNNNLSYLNLKNGNNTNMTKMFAFENPNLICIEVDDEIYANNQICESNIGWCKDEWAEYSEFCELGIEENNNISFSLYPNPAQDVLYIESYEQIETIKIYSLQGRLVKEVSSTSLDVSQLNTGLYFVQINFEGKTITKKFIKE